VGRQPKQAVARLSKGSLTGKKKLPVKITLTLGQTSLHFEIEFE
jgi:hypothetical protein